MNILLVAIGTSMMALGCWGIYHNFKKMMLTRKLLDDLKHNRIICDEAKDILKRGRY